MIHGVQLEILQSQKLHDPNRVKVCLEQCLLVPARLVYPVCGFGELFIIQDLEERVFLLVFIGLKMYQGWIKIDNFFGDFRD